MHIFKNPNFDFVRWKWHAIAISWVIILIGAFVIWTKGMPKGVEFSGGTIVIVQVRPAARPRQDPRGRCRAAAPTRSCRATAMPAQQAGPDPHPLGGRRVGRALGATADAVVALGQAGLARSPALLGEPELHRRHGDRRADGRQGAASAGLLATVFALAGILVYIAFRFRLSFAVGAVVATIHDLLITLALLAIFQYELSLNVIAALLTITGYSMNDTIVIFDRVRENMRSMRRDNIAHVVNAAVNQMLDRTMITGGLTMLSVIALYFFGGEVLKGFAFTMIVGIITGTYSSVFIAAAIVVIWQGRRHDADEAMAPAAPRLRPRKQRRKRSAASARAS